MSRAYSQIDYGYFCSATFQLSNLVGYGVGLRVGIRGVVWVWVRVRVSVRVRVGVGLVRVRVGIIWH